MSTNKKTGRSSRKGRGTSFTKKEKDVLVITDDEETTIQPVPTVSSASDMDLVKHGCTGDLKLVPIHAHLKLIELFKKYGQPMHMEALWCAIRDQSFFYGEYSILSVTLSKDSFEEVSLSKIKGLQKYRRKAGYRVYDSNGDVARKVFVDLILRDWNFTKEVVDVIKTFLDFPRFNMASVEFRGFGSEYKIDDFCALIRDLGHNSPTTLSFVNCKVDAVVLFGTLVDSITIANWGGLKVLKVYESCFSRIPDFFQQKRNRNSLFVSHDLKLKCVDGLLMTDSFPTAEYNYYPSFCELQQVDFNYIRGLPYEQLGNLLNYFWGMHTKLNDIIIPLDGFVERNESGVNLYSKPRKISQNELLLISDDWFENEVAMCSYDGIINRYTCVLEPQTRIH